MSRADRILNETQPEDVKDWKAINQPFKSRDQDFFYYSKSHHLVLKKTSTGKRVILPKIPSTLQKLIHDQGLS